MITVGEKAIQTLVEEWIKDVGQVEGDITYIYKMNNSCISIKFESGKVYKLSFSLSSKSLCDAIKSTKTEKRYVIYQDQKCELLGTTDAGGTLNTGGLAFCIILPDGKVKNVQDTHCTFL